MRIRTTKPDFWKSEKVAELSWDARLVWKGLWNYVDDNGVGKYHPKLIQGELFALESDPIETLARLSRALDELAAKGRIVIYDAQGVRLVFVVGWDEHQRVDRPSKGHGWPRPQVIPCGPSRTG